MTGMGSVLFTDVRGRKRTLEFPPDSQQIVIDYKSVGQLDMKSLSQFPDLKVLRITRNDLENRQDLRGIERCQSLVELEFSKCRIGHIELSPLASGSRLERLVLGENELTRLDLTPLQGCSELRELNLNQNRLTDIDLTPLTACPKLKRLYLSANEFKEIDLRPLSALTGLVELAIISYTMKAVNLAPLSELRGLRTLAFSVSDQEHIDLEPLRKSNLIRLWMSVSHPENIDLFSLMHLQLHTIDLSRHPHHPVKPADIDMTPLLLNRIENLRLGSLLISTVAYTHSTALSFFINSDIYNLQHMDFFIDKWGWARMRDILTEHVSIVGHDDTKGLHRIGLQEEVLRSMRLGWLAGLDADVIGVILDTPDDLSFERLQERVLTSGNEFLSEQLEGDGPTHFFDVEEMSKYPDTSTVGLGFYGLLRRKDSEKYSWVLFLLGMPSTIMYSL